MDKQTSGSFDGEQKPLPWTFAMLCKHLANALDTYTRFKPPLTRKVKRELFGHNALYGVVRARFRRMLVQVDLVYDTFTANDV